MQLQVFTKNSFEFWLASPHMTSKILTTLLVIQKRKSDIIFLSSTNGIFIQSSNSKAIIILPSAQLTASWATKII